MSFDRPWALALLVLPAILLWLRARAARPRAAEASSLLVWNKVSPIETVPERPRPPIAAWLEAAGAALLVLGVADPRGPAGTPAEPVLLLDGSPSMFARRPDGTTRIDAVRAAVAGELSGATMTEDPEGSLPALLAAGRPVVVVTDHRLPGFADDPPRLRVVGFGTRCFNAGITAVSGETLPDGRRRVLVTVEAHGGPGPAEGTLTVGGRSASITLQPGKPAEFLREIEAGEVGRITCRVAFPLDAFHPDDEVAMSTAGGADVHLVTTAGTVEPVLRALVAAGARDMGIPRTSSAPSSVRVVGGMKGSSVDLAIPGPGEGREVKGATVTTSDHVLLRGVQFDPSVTLGRRVPGETPGTAILSDEEGPLLTVVELPREGKASAEGTEQPPLALHFRFALGGSWVERDPSFVVLAKNIVDYAAGGATYPSGKGVPGALDARETREAAEGETFGDLGAALAEARRPDPATRTSFAFLLLVTGAGALFAAWLGMR